MEDTYILLYRSLMEKGYYKEPDYVKLWVHLLFKANHAEGAVLYKNKELKIKRGSFVTSRSKLARETGIQESKIERILKCFKTEQQIEQQDFRAFRLISIVNYEKRQRREQPDEQRVNSARTAREQPVNTSNQLKQLKQEEKKRKEEEFVPTSKRASGHVMKPVFNFEDQEWKNVCSKDIQQWEEAYPACDIQIELKKMAQWLLSHPKQKKKNYRAFITNWLTRAQDRGGTAKGLPFGGPKGRTRVTEEWAREREESK